MSFLCYLGVLSLRASYEHVHQLLCVHIHTIYHGYINTPNTHIDDTLSSLFSRFYLFACARCNHGVEFLRRLNMNIEEVVHLLLFNLTLQFRKRYYNLTNVIYPYARENWHALQLPPKVSHCLVGKFHMLVTFNH